MTRVLPAPSRRLPGRLPGRLHRLRLGLLLGLCLAAPAGGGAAEPDAGRLRAAAEGLGAWAMEAGHPGVLASAIEVLLATGVHLEPDDPWPATEMLAALGRMPGGGALAAALAASHAEADRIQGRGVTSGITRVEFTLAPGATTDFEFTFQAREIAGVEVRLKRGSDQADVDLRLVDANGSVLVEDSGPGTGRPGYGLYVEWLPKHCVTARAELANVGTGDARLVLLTQPSSRSQCDE